VEAVEVFKNISQNSLEGTEEIYNNSSCRMVSSLEDTWQVAAELKSLPAALSVRMTVKVQYTIQSEMKQHIHTCGHN